MSRLPLGILVIASSLLAGLVWIASSSQGADGDASAAGVTRDRIVAEPGTERGFWSFQKPARAELPENESTDRVRTPIDRFVLARLETRGLAFNPDAEPRTLLRRLYLDMVGLPPEPRDIQAFLSDVRPDAYERLVERVLASPRYGERWGRHWLDVVGFAESSLFIGDRIRPDFWRYRDYVIRAFNADKPFDEFVLEQLAGDEMFDWRAVDVLNEEQIEKLVATGFLRCPPDATDNQGITQQEKIYAAQHSVVEVSMKALLGLTLNCVRCHSHKYDPIPHEDYYKLVAVFQPAFDPARWLPGIYSRDPGPVRAIPLLDRLARETFFRDGQQEKKLVRRIQQDLPSRFRERYLQEHAGKFSGDSDHARLVELLEKRRSERSETEAAFVRETATRLGVTSEVLRTAYPEFQRKEQGLQERLAAIRKRRSKRPPLAWGVFDVSTRPSPTRLLLRGNYETPGREVRPGILSVLNDPADPFSFPSLSRGSSTTGRRLALGKWLVRSEHPLTARVMVNRIWQYHFGRGLVATPDDFGARGARPTHPGLLDWLAVEFVESDWSMKQMHRRILLSTTYRQSSAIDRERQAADPENRLLGHFPTRRLEAEVIRDSMLKVSGRLDARLYGPSVPTRRLEDGSFVVDPESGGRNRRTVYVSTRRTGIPNFLKAFDAPVMDTNCSRRSASTIPQQALAAMNNRFTLECAGRFAERVLVDAGETFTERLGLAYRLAYGRSPTLEETALVRRFVRGFPETAERGGGVVDPLSAWRAACQALLSSNEFLYVD